MDYTNTNISIWSNVSFGRTNSIIPIQSPSISPSVSPTMENQIISNGNVTAISEFSLRYSKVHGYVSIVVCIFGVISNILNTIVLTRKHMISPTNIILTALAIADMLTMSTYIPYAAYLYIVNSPTHDGQHSKGWVLFIVIHTNFIIICHTAALWLTVSLAVFRYIFVRHHTKARTLCSLYRAKLTVALIIIFTMIICIPNNLRYKVINLETENMTGYWMTDSDSNQVLLHTSFWLYGVAFKVTPCIVLTVLSSLLIHAMQQADKRRLRLHSQGRPSQDQHSSEHNRTTRMLVAVVLSVVITEFPQGILSLISGFNDHFFSEVYVPLGDVMDILVLINSAVNFILYCIMSQQFRETFKSNIVNIFIAKIRNHSKQNGVNYSSITTEVTQV